jgi:hypothetical protein
MRHKRSRALHWHSNSNAPVLHLQITITGSKLEAWDLLIEGSSSTLTAILEKEDKSEEESEGGGRWWEWSSQTISLVATTSLTCERVTGEGSGFRGARGTGGKPSVRVLDSTNSGDTCEDPGPVEGVRAERGDKEGGGVAKASGHLVARSHLSALSDSCNFLYLTGGRGVSPPMQ